MALLKWFSKARSSPTLTVMDMVITQSSLLPADSGNDSWNIQDHSNGPGLRDAILILILID